MKVKVTDPAHELFGQEVDGSRIYFDIYHQGGKPDLYQANAPDGKTFRLLTNQIDEEHYEAQELAREVERLGANVGDTVMINRLGSGCVFNPKFDLSVPHVITKISPSGDVEFDFRAAYGFRPDIEVVSRGER